MNKRDIDYKDYQDNRNQQDPEQLPDAPWLVIPYWTGDLGRKTLERPLPPTPAPGLAVAPGAIAYACPSIAVLNSTPGEFTPDSPTTVAVTVRNYGKGAAIDLVNLDLWWSPPTTEFGNITKKPPMAQVNDMLVRDSKGTHPPLVKQLTFTIPAAAGPHVCVLVRATVGYPLLPSDPNSSDGIAVWPADPAGDRHWAQRNLHAVTANSSGKFHLGFFVENSGNRDAAFRIFANEAEGPTLELLSRDLSATARRAEGASIGLRPAQAQSERDSKPDQPAERANLPITIGAGRRLALVLEGQLKTPLQAGEFVAFEVMQVSERNNNGHRQEPNSPDQAPRRSSRTGTIGVVVMGPPMR